MEIQNQNTVFDYNESLERFKYYLSIERSFSPNTTAAYLTDCVKFTEYIENNYPDLHPQNIELCHIERFLQNVSVFKSKNDDDRILKTNSLLRLIQSIRAYFKFLVMTDVLDKDISKLIDSPKTAQLLPDVLTNDEIQAMMNHFDKKCFAGFRNYLTVSLLYATGLRVSEFINLKLQNINFKGGYLDIIGKGNKQRYIPVAKRVLKDLKIYIDKYRSQIEIKPQYKDYVFVSERLGKKMTRQFINKLFNETALSVGIDKKIHPHILRHSFATELIRNGANLIAVKEMMGHSSVRSTEIYINLSTEDLKNTLEKYHPFYK